MPTQKRKNNNIRKITKLGKGSLAVTLPVEYINKLKWKEKQKVVVKLLGKKLIIQDWKK